MTERVISYLEAVREAMSQEMREDETVVFMGQDISGGAGREEEGLTDTWGGSFGVSRGMSTEFGTDRVMDCPLSEAGYMGAAATAATVGLKPIAELMFNDFLWLAGDQLFNGAAKFRYLSAGRITPSIVRATAPATARLNNLAFMKFLLIMSDCDYTAAHPCGTVRDLKINDRTEPLL